MILCESFRILSVILRPQRKMLFSNMLKLTKLPNFVIGSEACTERSRMCRNVILSEAEGSKILSFGYAQDRFSAEFTLSGAMR